MGGASVGLSGAWAKVCGASGKVGGASAEVKGIISLKCKEVTKYHVVVKNTLHWTNKRKQ